jgi:hypothetical protein
VTAPVSTLTRDEALRLLAAYPNQDAQVGQPWQDALDLSRVDRETVREALARASDPVNERLAALAALSLTDVERLCLRPEGRNALRRALGVGGILGVAVFEEDERQAEAARQGLRDGLLGGEPCPGAYRGEALALYSRGLDVGRRAAAAEVAP